MGLVGAFQANSKLSSTASRASLAPLDLIHQYRTTNHLSVASVVLGESVARWILQCNPARYRLLDALSDGFDVRTWTVVRYLRDIAPGDEVAMWISGPGGGVCVLGEVTRGAEWSLDDPDPTGSILPRRMRRPGKLIFAWISLFPS